MPKHAGGTNEPSNLIKLTIEEHAEAHRLLYEQYGRKGDLSAYLGLSGLATKKEIYQILLEERRGKPLSDEVKAKISMTLTGRPVTWGDKISKSLIGKTKPSMIGNKNASGNLGNVFTEDHKRNISLSKIGKPREDLIGNTYASALKGRAKSEEHQAKITAAINSDEVKAKIAATRNSKPTVKCPYCNVSGKEGCNMKRYHFDNCKRKI